MPAIRDHLRLRCARLDAQGIFGGTVSGNYLDVGMLAQPLVNDWSSSFEQHLDNLMFFEVDENGSVIAPLLQCPIVNSEHPYVAVARMRRMSVSPLVWIWKQRSTRLPASPPISNTTLRMRCVSRSVRRAYILNQPGKRSTNVCCGQSGLTQRNRRTVKWRSIPCSTRGKSCGTRWCQPCKLPRGLAATGTYSTPSGAACYDRDPIPFLLNRVDNKPR